MCRACFQFFFFPKLKYILKRTTTQTYNLTNLKTQTEKPRKITKNTKKTQAQREQIPPTLNTRFRPSPETTLKCDRQKSLRRGKLHRCRANVSPVTPRAYTYAAFHFITVTVHLLLVSSRRFRHNLHGATPAILSRRASSV